MQLRIMQGEVEAPGGASHANLARRTRTRTRTRTCTHPLQGPAPAGSRPFFAFAKEEAAMSSSPGLNPTAAVL